jgi:hypothetical protein
MNINDPIFAAIDAHRHACAETCVAYEHQSMVAEAPNDPRWIAANDAAGKALAVQDDLAVKLLETQPMTIAGAAALLSYYVDAVETKYFPSSMWMAACLSQSRTIIETSGIFLSATSLRYSTICLLRRKVRSRATSAEKRRGEATFRIENLSSLT